MNRTNCLHAATAAVIESLEMRRMLSASPQISVSDGILNILGTGKANQISVATKGSKLLATADGTTKSFNAAGIIGVIVNGVGGNDSITLQTSLPATLIGGSGDDSILGGGGNDSIEGDAGTDSLNGGGGNDSIYGNSGDDHLDGGTGTNQLFGGDGADVADYVAHPSINIQANSSTDSGPVTIGKGNGGATDVFTDESALHIIGTPGNDTISLSLNGSAIVEGGNGNDTLSGGAGGDSLDGGEGADSINGNDGNDVISGGLGDDTISGGDGVDTINGGDGTNLITFTGSEGVGGPGDDDDPSELLDYSADPAGEFDVTALNYRDTITRKVNGVVLGKDTVWETHNATMLLTPGNDTLNDNETDIADTWYVKTGKGDDLINGGAYNLDTGDGNDTVNGGAETLFTGAGDDVVNLGTIMVNEGMPDFSQEVNFDGGSGNNTLNVSYNGEIGDVSSITTTVPPNFEICNYTTIDVGLIINGNDSNNIITASAENVTVYGNGGDDQITVDNNAYGLYDASPGHILIDGGAGNDILHVNPTQSATLLGGAGDDVIYANDGKPDTIDGGDGFDLAQWDNSGDVMDQVSNVEGTV